MSTEGYRKIANIDQTAQNLHWTSDSNTEIPIKFKLNGANSKDLLVPRTIPQQLYENARKFKDTPSLFEERKKNKWRSWSWKDWWDESYAFARSLITFGVSHRSSVNIIGFNWKFWIWAFHGIILADCVAVGVYTTNTPQACQYVAEDSSAELVVAEDLIQAKKYLEIIHQLPNLKGIVVWGVDKFDSKPHELIMTWNEFIMIGQKDAESILDKRIEEQVPGIWWNIVYTSGTTGNPKGVMITHDNLFFSISQMLRNWESEGIDYGKERIVSYLPLSHSAAQVADIMSNLVARTQVYFARPDVLQGSLVETLQSVRPTSFFSVPRVFEKMEEKMKEIGSNLPSILQRLSAWAKSKGTLSSEARMCKKSYPSGYWLANLLVIGRIK